MPLTASKERTQTVDAEVKPIEFKILGQRFEAPPRDIPDEPRSWKYPDNRESTAGAEIEPLAATLPEVLTVNEEEIKFGPVPQRKTGGSDQVTGTRPFKKTREVRVETTFDGYKIEVHCRVTVRRNGKWYLWLRAGPVHSSGSRSPSATRTERSPDSESLNKKWING